MLSFTIPFYRVYLSESCNNQTMNAADGDRGPPRWARKLILLTSNGLFQFFLRASLSNEDACCMLIRILCKCSASDNGITAGRINQQKKGRVCLPVVLEWGKEGGNPAHHFFHCSLLATSGFCVPPKNLLRQLSPLPFSCFAFCDAFHCLKRFNQTFLFHVSFFKYFTMLGNI